MSNVTLKSAPFLREMMSNQVYRTFAAVLGSLEGSDFSVNTCISNKLEAKQQKIKQINGYLKINGYSTIQSVKISCINQQNDISTLFKIDYKHYDCSLFKKKKTKPSLFCFSLFDPHAQG